MSKFIVLMILYMVVLRHLFWFDFLRARFFRSVCILDCVKKVWTKVQTIKSFRGVEEPKSASSELWKLIFQYLPQIFCTQIWVSL